MNIQDFEVADIFWEIDLRNKVGWVLTVKGVSVMCDIGRDKSELRNIKNKIFEFPSAGTVRNVTLPQANIDRVPR